MGLEVIIIDTLKWFLPDFLPVAALVICGIFGSAVYVHKFLEKGINEIHTL